MPRNVYRKGILKMKMQIFALNIMVMGNIKRIDIVDNQQSHTFSQSPKPYHRLRILSKLYLNFKC